MWEKTEWGYDTSMQIELEKASKQKHFQQQRI